MAKLLTLLILALLLGACSAPPAAPTATVLPANAILVDASRSLGAISPWVLGSNHGPWTFLNPQVQPLAAAAGLGYLRFPGGNWGDLNDIETWQLDQFVALARQLGAEPAVSVRLRGGSPEQAAALVRYANVDKGYAIRYWSIGNEPSLYKDYDAARFNREWRAVALAMAAVDDQIVFVGPDTHQFTADLASNPKDATGADWLTSFLQANGDLVGIVAVHRYPFPKGGDQRALPSAAELLASSEEYDRLIPALKQLVLTTTGRELPVAVTEINSNWANVSGGEATPETFYNALWWADALGRLIRQQTTIVAQFCLTTLPGSGEIGLLARDAPRPIYYVYPLYARLGEEQIYAETRAPQVLAVAARRADGALTLILVNRSPHDVSAPLVLAGHPATAAAATWRLDRQHNSTQIADTPLDAPLLLPAESVTLLIIP